jgi:hypothetical protein
LLFATAVVNGHGPRRMGLLYKTTWSNALSVH